MAIKELERTMSSQHNAKVEKKIGAIRELNTAPLNIRRRRGKTAAAHGLALPSTVHPKNYRRNPLRHPGHGRSHSISDMRSLRIERASETNQYE